MGGGRRPGMTKRPPMVRETVSLYRAKSTLSALVERAAEGEEIVISKSGKRSVRPPACLTGARRQPHSGHP
jgi:antitoxin (DNA-binding transcriptional repressor) of toxin-antitoxin stability system